MPEPDYYKILGVSITATASEIKNRYIELSKKVHPDHGGDNSLMALINEAYKTLSEPTSRERYDGRNTTTDGAQHHSGHERPQATTPRPRPSYANTNTYTGTGPSQSQANAQRSSTAPEKPVSTNAQKRLAAVQEQISKTEGHIKHGLAYWCICGFAAFVILAGWSSPYVSKSTLIFVWGGSSVVLAYLFQQLLKSLLNKLVIKRDALLAQV